MRRLVGSTPRQLRCQLVGAPTQTDEDGDALSNFDGESGANDEGLLKSDVDGESSANNKG